PTRRSSDLGQPCNGCEGKARTAPSGRISLARSACKPFSLPPPERMIDQSRLERICREASQIALRQWPGGGHALRSWAKDDSSPVCVADLAVDEFLRRELQALLPSAGWLSEETVDHPERLARGLCWLVDPIDGTRDFIGGRDGWAVSVALISAGKPLIGILAAPARDEFWSATA